MKYTQSMKAAGEQAMLHMSSKALAFYDETDPLNVYEYENEDGETRYAYTGCFGEKNGLTGAELEHEFEVLWEVMR